MPNPLAKALDPIISRARTDITAIKLDDGSRWTTEPLTPARIDKHLNGGPPRGLCPIKEGESTTMVALLDLDSHGGETDWAGMTAAAGTLAMSLAEHDLPVTPWRSSGGRGIHLYMIWDDPQDAYSVRQRIQAAIEAVGYRSGARGVARHEVEVFPKQDHVAQGRNGNQFILPLAGRSVPLDPVTFEPLPRDHALGITWSIAAAVPVLERPEPARSPPGEVSASLEALRRALAAIPQESDSLDYDEWRNVIFALHYESGGSDEGLALAHEFSSRSPKYDPEFLDERVWPYIDSDRPNPITGGTILAIAGTHGYSAGSADDFEDISDEEEPHSEAPKKPDPFRVKPLTEFMTPKPLNWLIKGVVPRADLVVMYGAPASGKSFLAMDMAMAIARGIDWRGHRTTQARVVYLAAEGAGGARRRFAAYVQEFGGAEAMGVIDACPNLRDADQALAVCKAIVTAGGCDLLVIDTKAQVMAGGDENSSKDVGALLETIKLMQRALHATVLLIDHTGKDESRGARGWSGLHGAADASLCVVRDGETRAVSIAKMKDGDDTGDFGFRLRIVELGTDEDLEPITSCVVDHCDTTSSEVSSRKRARAKIGTVQKAILSWIDDNSLELGAFFPVEKVVDEVSAAMPEPENGRDRRREICRRAITDLLKGNFLEESEGKIRRQEDAL